MKSGVLFVSQRKANTKGDEWMIRLDKESYYTSSQDVIFQLREMIGIKIMLKKLLKEKEIKEE